MKRLWKEIRQGLKDMKTEASPKSPEVFWEDFRARASLRNRETAVEREHFPVLRWAAATVFAIVAVSAAVILPGVMREDTGVSVVNSIEVTAQHSGIVITRDEPGEGTVVWVADMKMREEA
ncbi:MAG: hypothetical protein R6V03_05865 [Kiritimatiellia bacterium]